MEIREVKFNLKVFIEDYIFAKESKDKRSVEVLSESFKGEYKNSPLVVQEGMEKFITKSKVALEYSGLQELISVCSENFKK